MIPLLRYIPPPHVSDRKWSEGDIIVLGIVCTPLAWFVVEFAILILRGLTCAN